MPQTPETFAVAPLAVRPQTASRWLHGLGTKPLHRYAWRLASVSGELALAAVGDRFAGQAPAVLEVAAGRAAMPGRALALYVHWSPNGAISAMVRRQVALWRAQGFGVVFISNAAPPAADWDAIAEDSVLRVRRRNLGHDFGAWRDALALAVPRFGQPEELLLANDSVLGPFRPLGPLVAGWRAAGQGLFGMTESLAGGPHLQSYLLLARGVRAVAAVAAHLAAQHNSRSKWRVVQRGEIGLSRRLVGLDLPVGALFDYPTLCRHTDTAWRATLGPRFAQPAALLRYPLNPTHHLWRPLVEAMGFPYLKRELLRQLPGARTPGAEWRRFVPAAEAGLIDAHMEMMERR